MSQEDCIRISVSILTPKAFSMRSGISPERPALPMSLKLSSPRPRVSYGKSAPDEYNLNVQDRNEKFLLGG
jgi:hypothetical protein